MSKEKHNGWKYFIKLFGLFSLGAQFKVILIQYLCDVYKPQFESCSECIALIKRGYEI
ncbi:MAG: hypothetical protein ACI9NN_000424 [Bacteroidia bacterium]|jgi:hypothetical protein